MPFRTLEECDGMLPLVESDNSLALSQFMNRALKDGIFVYQGLDVCLASMVEDQNVKDFMKDSKNLQKIVDEIEKELENDD